MKAIAMYKRKRYSHKAIPRIKRTGNSSSPYALFLFKRVRLNYQHLRQQ